MGQCFAWGICHDQCTPKRHLTATHKCCKACRLPCLLSWQGKHCQTKTLPYLEWEGWQNWLSERGAPSGAVAATPLSASPPVQAPALGAPWRSSCSPCASAGWHSAPQTPCSSYAVSAALPLGLLQQRERENKRTRIKKKKKKRKTMDHNPASSTSVSSP